ncbi:unannotated protein [freshwater metagenome]|uniref:Unannotated protein n=1 Tax=freshwater metagenome TaxID=449393 RepID=A0A6J6NGE3_9ZZZZ
MQLQRIIDFVFHALVRHSLITSGETKICFTQVLSTQVACHDDDGVAEVNTASLAVCKTTFFKNLQQRVEHVGVSFFNFVEQNNREWLATNCFSELTAFFVADVSRRRTNKATNGVLFHVFRHVERDESLVITEQEFSESLCKFCFTNTSWSEEDERTTRATRIFQAGACTTDALRNSFNGIFLTDDAFVKFAFHVEQLGGFFFCEFVHRDTGPDAEYFSNGFFVDFVEQIDARCFDFSFFFRLLFEQ